MTNLKQEKNILELAEYVLFQSCKKHFIKLDVAKKAYIKTKCLSHKLKTFDERCTFILITANHFSPVDFQHLKDIGIPNSILESFYVVRMFYKKGHTASLLRYIYSRPSVSNVINFFSKEVLFLGVSITCNVVEDDIGFVPLSPQNQDEFNKLAHRYYEELKKYQPAGFYKNYNGSHTFSEIHTYCIKLEDEIIGFCNIMTRYCGETHNSYFHIEDFYIKDSYSNVGIGKICAKKLFKSLYGVCSLDILENNLKARHFWNKIFTEHCVGVQCIKEMDGLYNYTFIPNVRK
jgi:predicted acetyltransferase